MGCKQTKVEPPSIVLRASPTAPAVPIYVKSALKNPRVNRKGKRSFLKVKSAAAKSVNFNEKVRVKVRTPTPKLSQYGRHSPKPTVDDDDDDEDDDNEQSSISSQEDVHAEGMISPPLPPEPPVQRTQPNGFWHKNNSVTVVSATNNIQENLPQPTVNTIRTSPTENSDILTGNRFIVRRRMPQTSASQTTNLVDPNPSSSVPVFQSSTPSAPVSVQRSMPITNTILIEHPTSFSDDTSLPKKTYVFKRQPIRKKTYTRK